MSVRTKILAYFCTAALLTAGILGSNLSERAAEKGRQSVEASAAAAAQKPVIVLDAGHGGADGGCVSVNGVPEKGINLSVMETTRDILTLLGYDVKCTRESDISIHDKGVEGLAKQKISDMDNRLAIINGSNASLAVSIHQNQFTDPKYYGAQMFYKADSPESERLAESLRGRFKALLQPENERETKPVGDELFLIHNAVCPAVMAECGFLSNPEEAAKLESAAYQREVAFALSDGINSYMISSNGASSEQ